MKGRPPGQLARLRKLPREVDELALRHTSDIRSCLDLARNAAGGRYVPDFQPLSPVEGAEAQLVCPACASTIAGPVELLRVAILTRFSDHARLARRHIAEVLNHG